ncbi:MAG: hypothetical protein HUJ31_05625 [Pseudomonadales bacterium]|nr:hypothetical protein [Pseudomonadales bacterium]
MKKLVLGLSLFCAIGLLAEGVPAVQIEGADQITPGMSFEELFVTAMPHKVNQAELDAFLAELDNYEAWGNANPQVWNAADETDDPVSVIMSWEELWSDSGLNAAGTIMVVMKLQAAQMMAQGQINKEQLKRTVAMMKDMLDNPDLSEELKVRMRGQLGNMQRMVDAIDKYPASNTRFYQNNKAAIDSALDRFEAIGQVGDNTTDE